jgi:hypothetical protein
VVRCRRGNYRIHSLLLLFTIPTIHHSYKMTRSIVLLLVVALVALSFAPKVAAFGAGNIPSYSHLEDRAFRHGDIEDVIEKRESLIFGH